MDKTIEKPTGIGMFPKIAALTFVLMIVAAASQEIKIPILFDVPAAIKTAIGYDSKTYPKDIVDTDTKTAIYRGISQFHPAYYDAKNGISKPIGGHSNPGLHRDGYTDSEFTSWTTDITIAYTFATTCQNGRCSGIILAKVVRLSELKHYVTEKIPGGDKFKEHEILIQETIKGAIPIPVRPGMTRDMIINTLKKML